MAEKILGEGLYIDIRYLVVVDRGESLFGIDPQAREEEVEVLVTEDKFIASEVSKIIDEIHHIRIKNGILWFAYIAILIESYEDILKLGSIAFIEFDRTVDVEVLLEQWARLFSEQDSCDLFFELLDFFQSPLHGERSFLSHQTSLHLNLRKLIREGKSEGEIHGSTVVIVRKGECIVFHRNGDYMSSSMRAAQCTQK